MFLVKSTAPGIGRALAKFQRTSRSPPFRRMVAVVVATTADPASIGPAMELLAMPGRSPGPSIPENIESFANGDVRLLKHNSRMVAEDDLDRRWESATGETVSEFVFLSRHTAASSKPALTVHPIGVPHLREDETPPDGGRPGWAALPNPRIGPWLRLLRKIAADSGLIPEFEITLEATHHGPLTNTPTMFVEIALMDMQNSLSTEEYWKRQDAAQAVALLLWEGLGLGGRSSIGDWESKNDKVLLGIGGGHYVPRHLNIALNDGVWVGHLLSGYSLPMEEPSQANGESSNGRVLGTWMQSIQVCYQATKLAFPGGEVLAHIDQKSFKSWQKNALMKFLAEQNIKVGKPADF